MSDLIDRQAAIDALRKMQTYKLFSGDDMLLIDQAGAQTELMLLPPAQPKMGKWKNIVDGIEYTWGTCDSCGARIPMPYKYYKYCPNCGMKNEVTE